MMKNNRSLAETIHIAQTGDREAQDEILRQYEGLIDSRCFIKDIYDGDDVFDWDCRQYIMENVIKQLPKFRGSKK